MIFVHVEDFFHPNAGYQLNLLSKLQVEQGHKVIIITSELHKVPSFLTAFFGKINIDEKDKIFTERTGVKIIRFPLFGFYSGRSIFKFGLHKLIKSLKPDVLFIHGEDTLTGIKLLLDYKNIKIPFVLDCHMLEMASVNKLKNIFRFFFRKVITPIILKNNIPLIRVVNSDFVEKHYSIPLSKTKLLSFGTDTGFYKPNELIKLEFKRKNQLKEDDFIVIYAGKLDIYKGGIFFAQSLKKKIELKDRNIIFIIIGTNSKDEYGLNVEKILDKSENKIIRFPTQTYFDLASFYQCADIAVFPKQCSMSYYEVQSCGLPVVLEENEINIDRVSNKKGFLFSENNEEEFRNAIIKFGNMQIDEFNLFQKNSRNNILQNYDYSSIAKEFSKVMINEYNRFHK
ncbi:glycosyltransferase family 4 protein [Daejeonella sp.]|jgi:glycosyltransferase involved in cell wall biosynthesis|uniref:glycosyltransferase family 4 protein n=1 Tax=Daejeonella sp. TaxID=2805397 RepID=UPI0037C03575